MIGIDLIITGGSMFSRVFVIFCYVLLLFVIGHLVVRLLLESAFLKVSPVWNSFQINF